MPFDIIVGAQWGDEGKGRIVDLLARSADYVARYSGGDNAGHTVTVGEKIFKLHLIPSGLIHPHTVGAIGNGVVMNPAVLLAEMKMLENSNIPVPPERLIISYATHLITPAHLALDRAQEAARGATKLGTTLRGIGPAYTDKVSRKGIRAEQMLDPEMLSKVITEHVENVNLILKEQFNAEGVDAQAAGLQFREYAMQLKPYVGDVSLRLNNALRQGKRILAEGAQGTLLDLDHGTYPFVTSSNPTSAGALIGLGIGAGSADRVIGVTKAFQTRVGEGPFPSELFDETAARLRGTGANPWDEFGTTTGRPRRVGWLDMVLLRYAIRINGFTELALTKLDILTGLPELKICTAYQREGKVFEDLPYGPGNLASFQARYETLPGWEEDVRSARRWEDLPSAARDYINRIETLSGIPVRLVSVGPEREHVVEIE